jgi:tartrate/fumarate subfamily iron-sulfur-dependent hydro-lyase beta chain
MAEFHLNAPLRSGDIKQLRIGDVVYFNGEAWTGRSLVHKRVFNEGCTLPFSTENRNLLIHVGPVVIREQNKWKLTSFNVTSSIQLDNWGPQAIREWGLKAIVGKTTMKRPTMLAMKEHICIHTTPIGVTPSLFLDQIIIRDVYWLDELGSIEAPWILEVKEFGPFLVDIDSEGNNYFDQEDISVGKNKKKAYSKIGITDDFQYVKLY